MFCTIVTVRIRRIYWRVDDRMRTGAVAGGVHQKLQAAHLRVEKVGGTAAAVVVQEVAVEQETMLDTPFEDARVDRQKAERSRMSRVKSRSSNFYARDIESSLAQLLADRTEPFQDSNRSTREY